MNKVITHKSKIFWYFCKITQLSESHALPGIEPNIIRLFTHYLEY